MTATQAFRRALEAIDGVLERGGDADEVLRAVVTTLREQIEAFSWVGIAFVEDGELRLGPATGAPPAAFAGSPVSYDGARVAELQVAGATGSDEERAFLDRVAALISAHCLVGWDTGGEAWEP